VAVVVLGLLKVVLEVEKLEEQAEIDLVHLVQEEDRHALVQEAVEAEAKVWKDQVDLLLLADAQAEAAAEAAGSAEGLAVLMSRDTTIQTTLVAEVVPDI